jgi:hypothetical protein
MAIRKIKLDCIISHGLDIVDIHLFLTGLQHFLARAVAAHFRGRRIDPQKFTGKLENFAITERNLQYSGLSMKFYFARTGSFFT